MPVLWVAHTYIVLRIVFYGLQSRLASADIACLAWRTLETAICHDDMIFVSDGTEECRLKNNCKHYSFPPVCKTHVMALWHKHTFGITDHLYGDAMVHWLPSQKCLIMQSFGGFLCVLSFEQIAVWQVNWGAITLTWRHSSAQTKCRVELSFENRKNARDWNISWSLNRPYSCNQSSQRAWLDTQRAGKITSIL